ncbi:leucine-rich repeat domain-containing protein [Candidatus Hydrogenedentota bacterium]
MSTSSRSSRLKVVLALCLFSLPQIGGECVVNFLPGTEGESEGEGEQGVHFPDANLEAAIRAWFEGENIPLGAVIYDGDLVGVGFTELVASGAEISDLTGLEYALDLQVLDLSFNSISNLTPLSGLTDLTSLELGYGNLLEAGEADIFATDVNDIADISPLASLTGLTYLNLGGNPDLQDISPLESLSSLETIAFGSNPISDFSPLASLTNLQALIVVDSGFGDGDISYLADLNSLVAIGILMESGLTDISALSHLNLETAAFMGTGVSDMSVFANWTDLEMLIMNGASVSNLSPLEGLSDLTTVMLQGCSISDISPLGALINLQSLAIDFNNIVDISPLEELVNLTQLGLSNNSIVDISPLEELVNLAQLDISSNLFEDIAALLNNGGIGEDDEVKISNNPFTEDVICNDLAVLRERFNDPENLEGEYECPTYWTLTINVEGGGTTDPPAGIYEILEGETVVIEAVGDTEWYPHHWEGDIESIDTTGWTLEFAMISDVTLTAVFYEYDYILVMNTEGNGRTVPEAGTHYLGEGEIITAMALPPVAYAATWVPFKFGAARFVEWQGDTDSERPVAYIEMDADKSVTAVFEDLPDEPIVFDDPNLEAAVREATEQPEGDIYPGDIVDVGDLYVENRDISDLGGLEVFTMLYRFNGYVNNLTDITPMAGLTNLQFTDVASNQITDVSPLSGLPSLKGLNFGANNVEDISGLTDLPSLLEFVAFENDISDITALARFTTLQEINLTDNQVADISPLEGLTAMKVLRIKYNQISNVEALEGMSDLDTLELVGNSSIADISAFAGLTGLRKLDMSYCAVEDISALENLPNLNYVILIENEVQDLTPLVNNLNFGEDDELRIEDNPLSQDAICNQIPILEGRGVNVRSNAPACESVSSFRLTDEALVKLGEILRRATRADR